MQPLHCKMNKHCKWSKMNSLHRKLLLIKKINLLKLLLLTENKTKRKIHIKRFWVRQLIKNVNWKENSIFLFTIWNCDSSFWKWSVSTWAFITCLGIQPKYDRVIFVLQPGLVTVLLSKTIYLFIYLKKSLFMSRDLR